MSVKHPELMHDPTSWATYVERLEARIAELEKECDDITLQNIRLRARNKELEGKVKFLRDTVEKLQTESAQWQESSGQNYVRACEAEAREEALRSEVERLRAFRDVFSAKIP